MQWWLIVNYTHSNKFDYNFNQQTKISSQENAFENLVRKMSVFCLGLNLLINAPHMDSYVLNPGMNT